MARCDAGVSSAVVAMPVAGTARAACRRPAGFLQRRAPVPRQPVSPPKPPVHPLPHRILPGSFLDVQFARRPLHTHSRTRHTPGPCRGSTNGVRGRSWLPPRFRFPGFQAPAWEPAGRALAVRQQRFPSWGLGTGHSCSNNHQACRTVWALPVVSWLPGLLEGWPGSRHLACRGKGTQTELDIDPLRVLIFSVVTVGVSASVTVDAPAIIPSLASIPQCLLPVVPQPYLQPPKQSAHAASGDAKMVSWVGGPRSSRGVPRATLLYPGLFVKAVAQASSLCLEETGKMPVLPESLMDSRSAETALGSRKSPG